MGLDMYVFRASKPDLDANKVYNRSDVNENLLIPVEDAAEAVYAQILPYAQKIIATTEYYDIDKLTKAFGLGVRPHLSMIADGYCEFSDANGKRATVTNDDIDKNYTISKDEEYFAVKIDEVAYWRKAYDVQNYMHQNINVLVENCGYYALDKEIIDGYNRKFYETHKNAAWPYPEIPEESALFYHEWY